MNILFDNYILPISGIDFVRFIAIFYDLSKYEIKPERIFSASGGCLSSYCAMMSKFSASVENWSFNSEMFIKKISPISFRMITFLTKGFLYHRQNIDNYITQNFIPHSLRDLEIITGFYTETNENKINIVLTTNFPKNLSYLKNLNPEEYIGKNLSVEFPMDENEYKNTNSKRHYLDYLMKFCIDAIYKTSNIPYLLNPIGEEKANDFGIISPSPRILAKANMKKSIYFSPVNLENNKKKNYELLFHQLILRDITSIESMLKKKTDVYKTFDNVLKFLENKKEYCIIAYCSCDFELSITNFTDEMIREKINLCKKNIKYIVFYN